MGKEFFLNFIVIIWAIIFIKNLITMLPLNIYTVILLLWCCTAVVSQSEYCYSEILCSTPECTWCVFFICYHMYNYMIMDNMKSDGSLYGRIKNLRNCVLLIGTTLNSCDKTIVQTFYNNTSITDNRKRNGSLFLIIELRILFLNQ